MKITTQTRRVNPQRELLACFDVSKATLNLSCRYEHRKHAALTSKSRNA